MTLEAAGGQLGLGPPARGLRGGLAGGGRHRAGLFARLVAIALLAAGPGGGDPGPGGPPAPTRKAAPDLASVASPPPGWFPAYWFGARHAWSVSLNPKKFDKPERSAVKVRVIPIGDDFVRREKPLEFDAFTVSSEPIGLRDCIIFRPKQIDPEEHGRYWVEIDGLTKQGKAVPIRYVVDFFEL